MTPHEIIAMCDEILADGDDRISLVIQKGISSRVPGFGRGELLCEQFDGSRLFSYDAHKVREAVLRALADHPEDSKMARERQ